MAEELAFSKALDVFDQLAQVIASEIWWYQGGAKEALNALLQHPDELRYLLRVDDNG